MSEPVTAVLADDHYLVREGLRQLLESSGSVSVVAATGNADELLDAVRRFRPHVVISDIRMPGPSFRPGFEGIDAAHRIRAEHPRTGVMILSQYRDALFAFELFRHGSEGLAYLLKDRIGDLHDLLGAISAVTSGGSVIEPQVVDGLVTRRARRGATAPGDLTPREREVLGEMALGKSNAGIARSLHLSVSAVEKNVNTIFHKLGLENTPDVHRRVAAVVKYLGVHP
ncbi:DNA-binding NarL/FixJ family response regulator [Thermocatellispora tengchongensis]|uniref:DNA-binding NarL/FixJ family response regulator n=1 Tax=Thermocatellispora tengchongensis TaxID=1073253 RepID=A0A840P074_9ACTN|nr:response regulator transcription factor [Thermocatellispora tengchongensis]MBB5134604.1 DNA-binding NarL/FixJ family response regulator [Thermocatellispora tengchongensis]